MTSPSERKFKRQYKKHQQHLRLKGLQPKAIEAHALRIPTHLQGFATATDLADYLVRKGIPFRDAHEVVGKAVAYCVEKGQDLSELKLEELQPFSTAIDKDVFDILTLEGSVAARDHIGGTAPPAGTRSHSPCVGPPEMSGS